MVKMKLNLRNALKSTLLELTSKTRKVLVFGEDRINKKTFCYPVDILRNRLRLLACTSIEIRSIGYYPHAERNIVNWLKEHIPKPTSISQSWWNICNNHNWLKYNIADDICIMKLDIAEISYYIVLRHDMMLHFRQVAYNKNIVNL